MPKLLQFIEMQVNLMVQQIIDPITVIPVEPEIFKLFIINYRNTLLIVNYASKFIDPYFVRLFNLHCKTYKQFILGK